MTVARTEQLDALKEAAVATKPRGLWSDAWRRLKKNKAAMAGAGFIMLVALVAILADVLAPHDPNRQYIATVPTWAGPFWLENSAQGFPLGTDDLSRDILSKLIYGARVSLIVGFVPVLIITLIGVPIGLLSGWVGGRWDNILQRGVDVVYAFPDLLFFIILASALRDRWIGKILGGLVLLFVALSLVGWTTMTRLVRGQVLSLKNKEFVEAARSIGTPTWKIILKHILPNSMAPIIVAVTFGVPSAILAEAVLAFLGLGVAPSVPSWGRMVQNGFAQVLFQPEFTLIPAAAIASIMIAFTFLGDGLRDALDPYMNK